MPGKVADFLRTADLEPAEGAVLDLGATVRRGQGCTLRVSAIPAVHRQFLDRCQPLDYAASCRSGGWRTPLAVPVGAARASLDRAGDQTGDVVPLQ
ncbi:hypothetical protein [Streptomyces brasiliensis]|uniref:Uncharacterized protein n=1 Tax=Streptomyces brasiliensis TaxID=1954 RepID=A0A917ULC6_9ACTN|nr:hypothetical protein [Streptomyces brasiliensis]GGJ65855.1 hypothetical protein GCM10010121_090700 [Streptomyces brasiliensis]